MMPRFIEFHEIKPDGTCQPALGSDSVLLWNTLSLSRTRTRAQAHADSLRGVGKTYVGFRVLAGPTLSEAVPVSSVLQLKVS